MSEHSDQSARTKRSEILPKVMDLIAREGWRDLSMGAIARDTEVPLAELYDVFPRKSDVLTALVAHIDALMLEELDAVAGFEGETKRDRLFDAVMARYEALEPFRGAVRVLRRELPRDPVTLAECLPAARRSLVWTLEGAGISASGLVGAVRTQALGRILAQVIDVWLNDNPADLNKTMAELDRRLRRKAKRLGVSEGRGGAGDERSSHTGAPQEAGKDFEAGEASRFNGPPPGTPSQPPEDGETAEGPSGAVH